MKINLQTRPPRIEMIPLIDIVFLLLVVFIYSMLSMAVHRSLPVALPSSSQARVDKTAPISVTVAADGSLSVDRQPVALPALSAELRRRAGNQTERSVLLFADRRLTYQNLFRVLDRIRQAGLTRIHLQAESEKPGSRQ